MRIRLQFKAGITRFRRRLTENQRVILHAISNSLNLENKIYNLMFSNRNAIKASPVSTVSFTNTFVPEVVSI